MRALGMIAVVCAACGGEPRAGRLEHEAYVWQRAWSGSVVEAVAGAGEEIGGLRVLALEIEEGGAVWPEVDAAALARSRRPVTAVVRIDGSRPVAALAMEPVVRRAEAWRAAGADVVGVEIDLDCATAALADYAVWLRKARPPGLRWSITALPAWVDAEALGEVVAAVDEVVLQVHAVRAPAIFEAGEARRWTEAFARRAPAMKVALPTYAVTVDGEVRRAEPAEVARFVRELERRPVRGVSGIVWFRLPVASDAAAWPAETLRAVIRDEPLAAAVQVELVENGEARDVVLVNRGSVDAPWPALRVRGAAVDLIGGYRDHGDRWAPPRRVVRPGARVVVGWVAGAEARVDAE